MRILIADDHPAILAGMCKYLTDNCSAEIVAAVSNGEELFNYYIENKPDLAIVDLSMPIIDGLDAVKRILEIDKKAKILFYSVSVSKNEIYNCYKIGGVGFIPKDSPMGNFIKAINCVKNGNIFYSDVFTEEHFFEYEERSRVFKNRRKELSTREKDILFCVARGYSNKEISDTIHISIKTIENHRRNIRQKLNLVGSAEFIKFALNYTGLE